MNGDGSSEIAVAPGPAASMRAEVRGFDYTGVAVSTVTGYTVEPFPSAYGARLDLAPLEVGQPDVLIVASGPDMFALGRVRSYRYDGTALRSYIRVLTAFTTSYGANVAGATLGP